MYIICIIHPDVIGGSFSIQPLACANQRVCRCVPMTWARNKGHWVRARTWYRKLYVIYIYKYICVYIYTYTYTYIYIYTYTHIYIHTYMHTYVHTYIRTHVHTLHTYVTYIRYIHALHTYVTYIPTYIRFIHTYRHTDIQTYIFLIVSLQWESTQVPFFSFIHFIESKQCIFVIYIWMRPMLRVNGSNQVDRTIAIQQFWGYI